MSNSPNGAVFVETEVPARPKRRRFAGAYKLKILAEADGCARLGEVGALLRREGLYPAEIYSRLLSEGTYVCSVRTMYRILAKRDEVRERRRRARHPAYARPQLLATRPNQVWSWGITKLRTEMPFVFPSPLRDPRHQPLDFAASGYGWSARGEDLARSGLAIYDAQVFLPRHDRWPAIETGVEDLRKQGEQVRARLPQRTLERIALDMEPYYWHMELREMESGRPRRWERQCDSGAIGRGSGSAFSR